MCGTTRRSTPAPSTSHKLAGKPSAPKRTAECFPEHRQEQKRSRDARNSKPSSTEVDTFQLALTRRQQRKTKAIQEKKEERHEPKSQLPTQMKMKVLLTAVMIKPTEGLSYSACKSCAQFTQKLSPQAQEWRGEP